MEKNPIGCVQLEGRLAALHQVSLELVQNFSLDSLLQRIVMIAKEQTGGQYAALGAFDEDGMLEQFIPLGMTPEVMKNIQSPVGKGLLGGLMNSRETIRIETLEPDNLIVDFPLEHPRMSTFLGVPIWQGNRQFGQIYLADKEDGTSFSSEDQQVIETLAAYAGVAIANARLYNQLTQRDRTLTRRNQNLALLNELASTLASSTDVDQILDKTLTGVMDYAHWEVGEVYLRLEDSTTLQLLLHRGTVVTGLWKRSQYQFGKGLVGSTAKLGQAQFAELPGPAERELDPAALKVNLRQIAVYPLTGHRGVLGVLCLATTNSRPLDELELQFLETISFWVGMVIENMRLNLQERRVAVLEERERIGMDLHDGVIQSIYAVGLILDHARMLMDEDPAFSRQRIEQAVKDLDKTIRDIRAYILDLRPRQLHDENLMDGIQRLVNEFRVNTLVDISLQGTKDGLVGLPKAKATALFHICQEALANIAKHARSRHVNVTLWTTGGRALLEVSDNGKGFDFQKVKFSLGHGLTNMQTRARNVGGDIDISTEMGEGTTIMAWVPFSKEE